MLGSNFWSAYNNHGKILQQGDYIHLMCFIDNIQYLPITDHINVDNFTRVF